jgi:DNA-binding MarR family transcriptional regulator
VAHHDIMMALNACGGLMFSEVVHRTRMDKARVSRAQRRLVNLELVNSVNDRLSLPSA